MQELFTFDPTTNTFTVNEKDITTGTPKQIQQKKRFNEALNFTVMQARMAQGTMNQYLNFKAALNTGIKLNNKDKNQLLKEFDKFYKKNVVKPFDTKQVPGYAPASPGQNEGVGDKFFDPIFYLENNPDVKAEYDKAVAEGNLDITARFTDLNSFAGGNYVMKGIPEGRAPNAFAQKGKFQGKEDELLGFEGAAPVTEQALRGFKAAQEGQITEGAVITAAGEDLTQRTEQFGLLAEDVLRQTIDRLERAQREQNQFDLLNNLGGFNEILNIGTNAANSLLGDLPGVPPGVRDQIEGTFNAALGTFGNSTIVNWQNFFEKDLTERYAKDYNEKFAALELEKDIFENAIPSSDDFAAYVQSRDDVLAKYNERIAGLVPGDPNFISISQFGKEFYDANKSNPNFRSRALEEKGEVFDEETGKFKDSFLREIGFQTSDEVVEYLKNAPGGQDVLKTLTGTKFVLGGKELDPYARIRELDDEIKRIDDPNNPDFDLVRNLRDENGNIRAVNVDSQFARDFINDYLRPRFNASKSINEFINFINVDEEFQNPFQTQTTQDALNNLATQKTQEFLNNLKPVNETFDAQFFENPFFNRPVEEQKAADGSRYERKLEFQKDFFASELKKAQAGDPKYINALLTRGVSVEPSLTFDGSLVYSIDKAGFARTLFDITRGGKDIEGNEILLDGAPITFAAFDNPIDPDRIKQFQNFDLIPSLIGQVERDGTSVFGDFISPEEFTEGVLDDAGIGPNTPAGRQLALAGGDDELDDIRNTISSVIAGDQTVELRERIKELADAGEEITQKTLGVDYIERETDKEGAGRAGDGLFGIFQQAGFRGTEKEFYESFFPGQSKEEVKAEFGDFDLLSGLNTSSPQAALSSIGSFLDEPLTPPSPDSFSDFDNTNNRIGTRKSRSGQSFLDDFTSDLGGGLLGGASGGLGGLGGFGGFGF
jgi:hypothetical protein